MQMDLFLNHPSMMNNLRCAVISPRLVSGLRQLAGTKRRYNMTEKTPVQKQRTGGLTPNRSPNLISRRHSSFSLVNRYASSA